MEGGEPVPVPDHAFGPPKSRKSRASEAAG
jgi:hypothetical protein